jgi:hypothetical protein
MYGGKGLPNRSTLPMSRGADFDTVHALVDAIDLGDNRLCHLLEIERVYPTPQSEDAFVVVADDITQLLIRTVLEALLGLSNHVRNLPRRAGVAFARTLSRLVVHQFDPIRVYRLRLSPLGLIGTQFAPWLPDASLPTQPTVEP